MIERPSDTKLALLAVLARKGPVSISPEDLEAAEDLELIVSEAPFGDPIGSKILEARKPHDPRAIAIERALRRVFPSLDEIPATAGEIIGTILEELDR